MDSDEIRETKIIETGKLKDQTQQLMIETSCKWVVNNFDFDLIKNGEVLQSPSFTAGPNGEFKWSMTLKDCGTSLLSLTVQIDFINYLISLVRSRYRLYLLNEDSEEFIKKGYDTIYSPQDRHGNAMAIIPLDTLQRFRLLPDKKLTAYCEIHVNYELMKNDLTEDFSRLLDDNNSEQHSDLVLVIGPARKERKAHKAILSTRSPVFAAMFEHDMLENRDSVVEIEDIEDEVVKEILRFIYIGNVENLEDIADSLLVAANKYGIQALKDLCEFYLVENIDFERVIDNLALADLHDASKLKNKAIDFIVKHVNSGSTKIEFSRLTNLNKNLQAELLDSLNDCECRCVGDCCFKNILKR